jgi:hypothetical protein
MFAPRVLYMNNCSWLPELASICLREQQRTPGVFALRFLMNLLSYWMTVDCGKFDVSMDAGLAPVFMTMPLDSWSERVPSAPIGTMTHGHARARSSLMTGYGDLPDQ